MQGVAKWMQRYHSPGALPYLLQLFHPDVSNHNGGRMRMGLAEGLVGHEPNLAMAHQ